MAGKVSVVIERDSFGYYAYSPELEGCQSQGDSFEEVMANTAMSPTFSRSARIDSFSTVGKKHYCKLPVL